MSATNIHPNVNDTSAGVPPAPPEAHPRAGAQQQQEQAQPRTLDRDIEIYTASEETYAMRLRRCVPSEEPRHQALRDAASEVVRALKAYRAVVDV